MIHVLFCCGWDWGRLDVLGGRVIWGGRWAYDWRGRFVWNCFFWHGVVQLLVRSSFFYKFTFDGFEIIGLLVIGILWKLNTTCCKRDNSLEDEGEIMITGFCFSTATLIYSISIFRNKLSQWGRENCRSCTSLSREIVSDRSVSSTLDTPIWIICGVLGCLSPSRCWGGCLVWDSSRRECRVASRRRGNERNLRWPGWWMCRGLWSRGFPEHFGTCRSKHKGLCPTVWSSWWRPPSKHHLWMWWLAPQDKRGIEWHFIYRVVRMHWWNR